MGGVVAPVDNFAFEMQSETCVSESIGSERLESVTAWLEQEGHRALLGEFGGARNEVPAPSSPGEWCTRRTLAHTCIDCMFDDAIIAAVEESVQGVGKMGRLMQRFVWPEALLATLALGLPFGGLTGCGGEPGAEISSSSELLTAEAREERPEDEADEEKDPTHDPRDVDENEALAIAGCSPLGDGSYGCVGEDAYATCLAYLVDGQLTGCHEVNSGESTQVPTPANMSELDKLCAVRSTNPTQVFCSDPALYETCRGYQRAGAALVCFHGDFAEVRDVGYKNPHVLAITTPSQPAPLTVSTTGETPGGFSLVFSAPDTPAPPPASVCDPACPLGPCTRTCEQLDFKAAPDPADWDIFSIWRGECAAPATGVKVKSGVNHDLEARICRALGRIRGVTAGELPFPWARGAVVTGKFCFSDPTCVNTATKTQSGLTTSTSETWDYTNQCLWVDLTARGSVPSQVTCTLTNGK